MSPFFLSLIVNPWTSMQSALDIPSASPTIDSQPEGEIPKVDKPPSPFARKPPPKTLNPPGSKGTCIPIGVMSNPTSPPTGDSKHDATTQSPRPDPTRHQDASPISPKSFGLGAHGGQQLGEGPSVPRPEKQPRQHSRVVVPVGLPGLRSCKVPHRSILVGSHEYPSQTRTNQGPLLQYVEYL
jgi:hypothetical protein